MDETSGQFACNKCVFEKQVRKPLFMATFARKTKSKFDDQYDQLLKRCQDMQDLTPDFISQMIQGKIKEFFAMIHKQLKDMERDLLMQIKSSAKLKDIAITIESLTSQFDEDLMEQLEQEKGILDEKVDRARYGYIVVRRDYYKDLVEQMELMLGKLTDKIMNSSDMIKDLLKVNCQGKWLNEKLYDIIDEAIIIDN